MKIHTTNYYNTFIRIAEDCPVSAGELPPVKTDTKSVANIQYDIIKNYPYRYTSDDIMFQVYAIKNDLTNDEIDEARKTFFSKGQPCLRTSPLTKRYGWGIHHDENGRVAIYGAETDEYMKYSTDAGIKNIAAIRSKRA